MKRRGFFGSMLGIAGLATLRTGAAERFADRLVVAEKELEGIREEDPEFRKNEALYADGAPIVTCSMPQAWFDSQNARYMLNDFIKRK